MTLLDTVRVKVIRSEIVPILEALSIYETAYDPITITGWQDLTYRPDGAHADGRAIDIRTRDHKDPDSLAEFLRDALFPISPHYILLWGDAGHKDHIHIGYHKEMR